jgi:hypothetical protein
VRPSSVAGGLPCIAIGMGTRTPSMHNVLTLGPISRRARCAATVAVCLSPLDVRTGRRVPVCPGHTRTRRRARIPASGTLGLRLGVQRPDAGFGLPSAEPAEQWRAFALPPQTIRCHPHLVLANGLDLTHYETLRPPLHGSPSSHGTEPTRSGRNARPPAVASLASRLGTRHTDLVARSRPTAGAWRRHPCSRPYGSTCCLPVARSAGPCVTRPSSCCPHSGRDLAPRVRADGHVAAR